ncbi:plasmid replication initiator protein [Asticcacaulis sp. AC460]|uniref:replication initiator protein A n=1 Tax=Asticcacaulis sp. AC460 TaxID=1282360 RepID=UPI0003C3AC6A|nr:replication initiator protein A [Asticcacaulis sp. AC460]ESQ87950.1 plasmid replication initiator protein [Asticcacaulis sp. AC460]
MDISEKQEQIDLFLPYLADLNLRDQREVMERPFFSLAKSKRLKPIDYTSPDGKTWVHVSANPDYGMATIWDADILIYCASILNDLKERRANEIPRTLKIMPYDLLRSIGRPISGRSYELLGGALDRLQSTTIKTNIRAEQRREATFSWLDNWSQLIDAKTEKSRGLSISLSSWFYDGVLMSGGVLSIDRAYFDITGGRERWLYKVVRKHAGGAGEEGFAISLTTLFEKSGAEGQYRRFKFEIAAIVRRNDLPGFNLALIDAKTSREPLLLMTRNSAACAPPKPKVTPIPAKPLVRLQGPASSTPLREPTQPKNYLTDETLEYLRKHYRGWDFHALHAEFRAWIREASDREPELYQSAFIGFVKRYHEKNRFQLGGR